MSKTQTTQTDETQEILKGARNYLAELLDEENLGMALATIYLVLLDE